MTQHNSRRCYRPKGSEVEPTAAQQAEISARRLRRRAILEDFDIEVELAMWKRVQKIAPIDKQLHRLEMTLYKFVQKSAHSGNEAPSHIGKPLHQRCNHVRDDLVRLAMTHPSSSKPPASTTPSTTPDTPTSSSGQQSEKEERAALVAALEARYGLKTVDLTKWNDALKFIENYTAWLLPFRGLIEDAQHGLFPPGSIVLEARTIEHPAREVAEAARQISTIASIVPSRAIGRELKPRLWVYFETLLIVEHWYQDNRVLDPIAKP